MGDRLKGEENRGRGRASDSLGFQKSQETVGCALDKKRGTSFSRRQERSSAIKRTLLHAIHDMDKPQKHYTK